MNSLGASFIVRNRSRPLLVVVLVGAAQGDEPGSEKLT